MIQKNANQVHKLIAAKKTRKKADARQRYKQNKTSSRSKKTGEEKADGKEEKKYATLQI